MRRIMVLNAKGGSGKSTVAINMASYYATEGRKVVLADLDPQGSSTAWLKARPPARPPIHGIEAYNAAPRPARGTEYLIMDAPAGTHGKALADLVRRAESIVIPVLPSPLDMRAAGDFIQELRASAPVERKQAKLALVANRARENTNVYWELDDFLTRQRVPFLTMLRDNQNYIRAAERGVGIFELGPVATAVDRELWAPIIDWLKSKRSRP